MVLLEALNWRYAVKQFSNEKVSMYKMKFSYNQLFILAALSTALSGCSGGSTGEAVADTTAPIITLLGDNPLEITIGSTYSEQGYSATDNVDGNITGNVLVNSIAVNANMKGGYSVTYNVSDAAGNAAAMVTRTVNVITSDTTAPTVSSVTPKDEATKVSRTTPIIATFDEDLFAVSVDNSSFSLSNGSSAVPATISLNSANEVTLQANSKLSNLTSYTATLTTGVTDLAGNELNQNYAWSFTTEDGNWGNTTSVEVGNDDAALPKLSMDVSGNGLAVWMQGDDIWANRYSGVNDTWGTAIRIETGNERAHSPKIGTDSHGNALAVWVQSHDSEFSIWANRFSVDNGSWGEAVLIEQIANDAIHPEIAVDSSGNALAVWSQQNDAGAAYNIRGNRYSANNNSWSGAETIEDSAGDAKYPKVAVDDNGNAVAVWHEREGLEYSIWANRYDVSNNSWGGAEGIGSDYGVPRPSGSSIFRIEFTPDISVDGNGNALTVWSQTDGTQDNIWASRFSVANDNWGTATMIEHDVGDARRPAISVDRNGNALAIWYQSDSSLDTTRFNRYSIIDSSWGTAALIETDAGHAYSHQITHDNSGNALAVWQEADGAVFSIRTSRYNANQSSWEASVLIEAEAGGAEKPQIAIDGSGNALAIWEQNDGSENNIMANKFD